MNCMELLFIKVRLLAQGTIFALLKLNNKIKIPLKVFGMSFQMIK